MHAQAHHNKFGATKLEESGSSSEFVTRTMRKVIDEETAKLENGLTVLASVGSTAPFVGLFGTVWGVYHALVGIGLSDGVTINRIAGPVGEALIMTGLGLAVAIPAVLAYNTFVRNNRVFLSRLDAFAHDLFAFPDHRPASRVVRRQVRPCVARAAAPNAGANKWPLAASRARGRLQYRLRDQHGAPDRRHAGAAGDLHHHGAAAGALDQDQHAPGGGRADRGRAQDRGPGHRRQRRAVLGREPVNIDDLPNRFKALAGDKPQPEIRIRADQNTRYETLAKVMASARRSGMTRIGFVTTPPSGGNGQGGAAEQGGALAPAPPAEPDIERIPITALAPRFHRDRARIPACEFW